MTNIGVRAGVALCVFWAACSSSTTSGPSTGTAGAANGGDNSGHAGSGLAGSGTGTDGGSVPIHCEPSSDNCTCVSDPKHVWGPGSTGGTCPPADFKDQALCCAMSGYPASGTCNCTTFTCSETGLLCLCGIAGSGTLTKCTKPWSICCMIPGTSCYCDDDHTQCDTGETRVPTCDLATMRCELSSDMHLDMCAP